MCNVSTMNTPPRLQVSGPATEALERLSKKRKLSAPPLPTDELAGDAFDFGDLFESVSPEQEAFPSLSWDDSDDETPQQPAQDSFSSARKRCRSAPSSLAGLMRSKSFKRGLCSTVDEDEAKTEFSDLLSKSNFDARLSASFSKLDDKTLFPSLELKGC
mmetsp:Transcript_65/g.121  ORF Transcript_65/g.121 Transcript_65/m.121 type:complete len:159 (-) Transcript_65:485-961(-)